MVAGKNFGVGSSRPVAALFRTSASGPIAEEFNSLFFRNAINAGLPALTVPDATGLPRRRLGGFDIATGDYRNETAGTPGHTAMRCRR